MNQPLGASTAKKVPEPVAALGVQPDADAAWRRRLDQAQRASLELAERPSLLTSRHRLSLDAVARWTSGLASIGGAAALATTLVAPWPHLLAAAIGLCLLALLVEASSRLAWRPLQLRSRSEPRDALLIGVAVTGLILTAHLTGGGASPLAALPLLLVVLAGAALPAREAMAVAGGTALLLSSLYLASGGRHWAQALGLAATALATGGLAAAALRGTALRFRDRAAAEAELRLQHMLEDARRYRLTGALEVADHERKRAIAAAMAVRESFAQIVEVTARALRPYTAMLLWLDESAQRLQVRELRTSSDHVVDEPIDARRGVLGSVVQSQRAVNLTQLKPDADGITYYRPGEVPLHFLAAPVFEGEHLRGVLAVDRREGEPFTPADEALLCGLAREVVRAVEAERLFAVMDRDRRGQEAMLTLIEALNQALSLEAVLDALTSGLRAVARCPIAAVVLVEERQLTVRRACGAQGPLELEGATLDDEGSLVASAIRTQAALPARSDLGAGRMPLFGRRRDPPDLKRGKVLPLIHQGDCLGALVVATDRARGLGDEVVRLLHLAAGYAAVSIVNGRLYARMEHMATRDGLTGLINHRAFQEQLEQALARCRRGNRPLTLMLCDIDHFKKVNDTHG
ncbi:MAG: diguanylate cyclase, partial [Deltaproteobacteria bacterium]|nr:diguanylate cyclase [Deltaproteobacteria bacterium]